jgi:hypothetical protein
LWFGIHEASHAPCGMLDLLDAAALFGATSGGGARRS